MSYTKVYFGADGGSRTPDLRFTKPLLYQLSYVGNGRHSSPPARRPAFRSRTNAR